MAEEIRLKQACRLAPMLRIWVSVTFAYASLTACTAYSCHRACDYQYSECVDGGTPPTACREHERRCKVECENRE